MTRKQIEPLDRPTEQLNELRAERRLTKLLVKEFIQLGTANKPDQFSRWLELKNFLKDWSNKE